MTIRDIAEVTWAITTLDITARDESTRYLHRWIIGERAAQEQPAGIRWDWRAGRISLMPRKINAHGDCKANGQPEMGWGLKPETVPKELLDAPVTLLSMRCANGISYEVAVDVLLSALEVEMLKTEDGTDGA